MTPNTLAVLPFVNRSPDPDNEYFCDGITEEIINALARIEQLKVTSRTSSFQFKGQALSLREIAEQLGVAVILEGSIRLSGRKVRIMAQLVQAEEDFHFWSETWDRQLDDIFAIQDEISLLIAEKLREQFGHFEIEDHLVEPQTDSLDAYAYALKARYYHNQWNPSDVKKAIELFEKAIVLDPRHTESYVGLADAYGFLATTQFMDPAEGWQKAAAYTQQAFELNPKNAGVHYQLSNLAFFTECDFAKAFEHALESIRLKPNYPEAQQFVAFLYTLEGSMKEAEKHLGLALLIDPLSQETLFFKAFFDYRNGDYQSALRELDACLQANPNNIPAYVQRSYCLLMEGRYQETLDFINQIPQDITVEGDKQGIICLAHILAGHQKEAAATLGLLRAEAAKPDAFQAHSYLFMAYACLEEADAAFEWLEEALQLNSSVLLLSYSGQLSKKLSSDPRYRVFHERLYGRSGREEEIEQKTALLDEATTEEYRQQLLQFMEAEEPYLNPGLSLRSLAEQIEVHPNKLSWLLNESLGKNYNTFINQYRVAHFKKLALNPANAHISLLGLAYESGFNSKTVFNTYFKKETGMTPRAFLKSADSGSGI
ncbi:MAG: helix-turn-helix domain-containing protein [Phaeodactylibacter sp.]|uniref:tetratricopeptide repeat protein n=1 Tax=Phaeodactylibacter sp. TaxID=1940289 RepID=UPI0032EE66EB